VRNWQGSFRSRGRGHAAAWHGLGGTLACLALLTGTAPSRAQFAGLPDLTERPAVPTSTPVTSQTPPGKDQNGTPPTLPLPRPVPPFGPGQFRLPQLGDQPTVIGKMPHPTKETLEKYHEYVKELVDPAVTLDLTSGRTRLMVLKEAPKRVQIADDGIACFTLLTPKELSLLGKNVGVTVLNLWFADPKESTHEHVLSYYIRVAPDPTCKERLECAYKALADEINHAFPNSVVCLQLVGDKLVVSGHAHDIAEATQILRVVRGNAPSPQAHGLGRETARIPVEPRTHVEPDATGKVPPSLEDYETGGSPWVINLLRIEGEQQVMLRVTVAEVNRAAARSIGVDFSVLNRSGRQVFANNTGSIATGGLTASGLGFGFGGVGAFGAFNGLGNLTAPGVALGPGGFNNLPAALDNGRVNLAISALRDLNYARSLAEPNIVAINGQTASFQAGGTFPVPVVTGFTAAGLQGVTFVPYGVQLDFTPYITDRDRIRLVVSAVVSSRDLSTGTSLIGGTAVPSLITRNFQTTVELRDGQTLAVAGLIQNNLGADSTRVPLFGDLPLIGTLASFNRITAGEQELVVLITPELVHPMDHKEVPPLPGADLFEPSDLEFYLLGRIESHRPYDYRSPVRTDWQRMHEYRQYENMYLSGPHGDE
jgi:pilus assembly protein CpaC